MNTYNVKMGKNAPKAAGPKPILKRSGTAYTHKSSVGGRIDFTNVGLVVKGKTPRVKKTGKHLL